MKRSALELGLREALGEKASVSVGDARSWFEVGVGSGGLYSGAGGGGVVACGDSMVVLGGVTVAEGVGGSISVCQLCANTSDGCFTQARVYHVHHSAHRRP